MSDKPLCYQVTVTDVAPIPGKDFIGIASLKETGFKTIVKKSEFKPGDVGVYFETGSILPLWPQFSFLQSSSLSAKYKGYKIKTQKYGGAYSEGLLMPYEVFSKDVIIKCTSDAISDLTEVFNVRRIEDEVPDINIKEKKLKFQRFLEKWAYRLFRYRFTKQGFGVWDFPTDIIPKTDETQVQSLSYVFEALSGMDVYTTIKCDGQSGTYILKDGIFSVSSRNRTVYRAKLKKAKKELCPEKYSKMVKISTHIGCAAKYDLPAAMEKLLKYFGYTSIAVQAEVCGPGIQKNRLGLADYEMFVFSVYNIEDKRFYQWSYIEKFCKFIKVPTVPFIEYRKFDWKSVQELEKYAEQFMYESKQLTYIVKQPAEGVVIRAAESDGKYIKEAMFKMNAMLSLKCINPKFKMATQDQE
jgi:hypothetical protein